MEGLTSIRAVADHFGLPISTLHYWERRGLITPRRHAGSRHYDTDQLYRIALVQMWRDTGTMSIDEIARVLDDDPGWRDIVAARADAITAHMAKLDAARNYLAYLLTCGHPGPLERCPSFRSEVDVPGRPAARPRRPVPVANRPAPAA
ncbi:hypothetical protein HUW46_01845 [Amycolatopsis sp. CA-230715]|nr:hypothetical protein HUW46_01845 [Amycolatopsis sp. CA-230715]